MPLRLKLILSVLVGVLVVAFVLSSETEHELADHQRWMVGGSLHGGTLADWRTAAGNDKLATAADWIVGFAEHRDITKPTGVVGVAVRNVRSERAVEELRGDAETLVTCMERPAMAKKSPGAKAMISALTCIGLGKLW